MRPILGLLVIVLLGLLVLPSGTVATGPGHYLPRTGDRFAYSETVSVTNGQGNYTGYTETGSYDGSISVTGVAPNGTVGANYQSSGTYRNSLGANYPWSESGSFTFSPSTYRYVQGTDNQTGYSNPYVWFYANSSLGAGATFFILNSQLTVVSTDAPFADSTSSTGYVTTIFAEGNGSYQRNDVYGRFSASYNWKSYFDPGTGYIVGYVYTEVDTDPSGDGFTWTDTVTDTSTSFALTAHAAPAGGGGGSGPAGLYAVYIGVAVVVVIVVVVAVLLARRRSAAPGHLAQHPTMPSPGTLPTYAPPPPVDLIPRDQPAVQQVVVRETVKVPCQYCGTLMDSTATVCPRCGATRT
ncbi:MAG TPA: hypothetical protein VGV89_08325 [Thermoplasmata archaeon]|nr:hypothetical protein [Thermoplasmata archaeon]